jgi:2,5-diketo-D-gluconate reductase A
MIASLTMTERKAMQYVTLNNDIRMPALGFGVFQVPDPAECERAVALALETGYRLIDTAASYANEEAVGRALATSGIPREEMFVTTKLWVADAGHDRAKAAFARSLEKLGLEYLDLYLIHQPYGDYYGAWRAMEELYADGATRAIGVSNFQTDRLIDLILNNDVTPAVNQIETHVFHQRTADETLAREHKVQIEAWGPFAEGKSGFFTNPTLTEIARSHGKTVAQVALRWLIQRGVVAIPKSVRAERMAENFDVFDFSLSDYEMHQIATLDTHASLFFDHRDPEAVVRLNSRPTP